MLIKFYKYTKEAFLNLEPKALTIMKNGLSFSFIIAFLGIIILITYLFFIHNYLIYKIGLLIFQLGLYFAADFIVSGLAVDSIKKQIL